MSFQQFGTRLDVAMTKRLDKPNMSGLRKLNITVASFYGVHTREHAEAIKRMVRENEAVFGEENSHE
ncbi:hypothetical protein JCM15519_17340 [Fundidesulfovibrio butyratiphilus]